MVSTIAGNGTAGFIDGAGSGVEFFNPTGLAVDGQGNIYVADSGNNRIRIIKPGKLVSTFAGTGVSGYLDGPVESAQFNALQGVAVDRQGNVYVSDSHNYCIRKILSSGLVSTLAGNGQSGFSDGSGINSKFIYPQGITVDKQGNVYVADNNRIRKITPAGMVTTFAGTGVSGYNDGPGQDAQFSEASAIAIDSGGNVYVADYGNNCIRKISSLGVVSTLAGTGVAGYLDGSGAGAQFKGPRGITIDSNGNLYVAEVGNNDVRKITLEGVVSSFAGFGPSGYEDGPIRSAKFKMPGGLATDSQGRIFVADSGNNYIREIN